MSFDSFSQRIIDGGTVTDADVNEWIGEPWYRRFWGWLRG